MRVTRDQRGYETTFLLYSPRPGDRPKLLYWYRTAPGVRVGRGPLDEETIRTLEEQYPEIEFDWPRLLEEAESVPPEVERRPERPRRRPQPKEAERAVEEATAPAADDFRPQPPTPPADLRPQSGDLRPQPDDLRPRPPSPAPSSSQGRGPNSLLDQLVGREIAARLRGRYAEIAARIEELPEGEERRAWQERADALDPDKWETPEAILNGIQHADNLFDELKTELG